MVATRPYKLMCRSHTGLGRCDDDTELRENTFIIPMAPMVKWNTFFMHALFCGGALRGVRRRAWGVVRLRLALSSGTPLFRCLLL